MALSLPFPAWALLLLLCPTLFYLSLHRAHRDILLTRLGLRDRPPSSPTPPRSTTPEKEPAQPSYTDVYPPHLRAALADLPANVLRGPGPSAHELASTEPDYNRPVPDDVDLSQSGAWEDCVTPTGFSVREVRRLGDFPDYATLSGVPLPEAVGKGWEIERALSLGKASDPSRCS